MTAGAFSIHRCVARSSIGERCFSSLFARCAGAHSAPTRALLHKELGEVDLVSRRGGPSVSASWT